MGLKCWWSYHDVKLTPMQHESNFILSKHCDKWYALQQHNDICTCSVWIVCLYPHTFFVFFILYKMDNYGERKQNVSRVWLWFMHDSPWLDKTFVDFLNVSQWNGSERLLVLGHIHTKTTVTWEHQLEAGKHKNSCSSPYQFCSNWLRGHLGWKTASSSSSSTNIHHSKLSVNLNAELICWKRLGTHHISLFDTVTTSQHTRPVSLPLPPFSLFALILQHLIRTIFVIS